MDLTLCNNFKCSTRTTCLRFMGKPESVQGYITPRTENRCNKYILNNTRNRTKYSNR